jgi:vacuolar-type H+-ATPase subunit E/Vma4
MTSIDENIIILSKAVLSDQNSSAEQILADARGKADEIRKHAQERAAIEREKILEKAREEAERLRSQAVAITQLKARTMELDEREKIIESVFEIAGQKLASVQDSAGYDLLIQNLLREALSQLGASSAKVRADQQTSKVLSAALFEKLAINLKIHIELGEPLGKGAGVIVETTDGRRQYDNTFETRLKRLQDTLRSPVYHILMGETL